MTTGGAVCVRAALGALARQARRRRYFFRAERALAFARMRRCQHLDERVGAAERLRAAHLGIADCFVHVDRQDEVARHTRRDFRTVSTRR